MEGLKDLVDITVKIYYEIKDAGMFGGAGTVGYSMMEMDQCGHIENMTDDLLDKSRRDVAAMFKVNETCVRMISKEEYDANVEIED